MNLVICPITKPSPLSHHIKNALMAHLLLSGNNSLLDHMRGSSRGL